MSTHSKDLSVIESTRERAGRRKGARGIAKRLRGILRSAVAMLCIFCLVPSETFAFTGTQPAAAPAAQSSTHGAKLPADQLDSLVAPVALYSDPLLAQVLAASTYPLEIIQLQQWLAQNPSLKDKALADAVARQPWDASVQALAPMPEAVKRLANDIGWTTDLGNAFLAQQSDVMDAVQRMRQKAQSKGNLATTEQQKVETKVVDSKQVIVIEPPSTEVIYVPSYDPMVVYGAPVYPYPAIYYPPAWYYPAGMAISFGVGVMMGAFWSGGWGWGCGWGGNDIYINHNNNFNRNTNVGNRPSQLPSRGGNVGGIGGPGGVGGVGGAGGIGGVGGVGGNRASQLPANGRGNWQHNPEHRGGAAYNDRATADRFGGSARGDSLANRQASARQQISRQGGNLASPRTGNVGGLGGGLERVSSHDLSRSGSAGKRDSLNGGNRGFDGANSRGSSNRSMKSMSGKGGGGFSKGGFGKGGFGGGGGRMGGGRR
ncbi:MAG TPA: DUF3300 domain-containing protein [Terracidiphilus sp.]|nr:DUF3300 domain-containing protein [Terracidiphilus sp.]